MSARIGKSLLIEFRLVRKPYSFATFVKTKTHKAPQDFTKENKVTKYVEKGNFTSLPPTFWRRDVVARFPLATFWRATLSRHTKPRHTKTRLVPRRAAFPTLAPHALTYSRRLTHMRSRLCNAFEDAWWSVSSIGRSVTSTRMSEIIPCSYLPQVHSMYSALRQ